MVALNDYFTSIVPILLLSKYSNTYGEALSTSIIQKALDIGSGIHNYFLSGASYNGNDLPTTNYQYGAATIYKRSSTSIRIVLFGSGTESIAYNDYFNNWSGWKICLSNTNKNIYT